MAWLMFKDSGSYQPRGKKCVGFQGQIRSKMNLGWGMQNQYEDDRFSKMSRAQYQPKPNAQLQTPEKHQYFALRKSQEEELDKIMKKYDSQKKNVPALTYSEEQIIQNNSKIQPILSKYPNHSALNRFINRQRNSAPVVQNQRIPTEESIEKIQFLQNSLMQPPFRKDSVGPLLNSHRIHEYDPMVQSRVSRRSSSGNKKNESVVMLGDGQYNQFTNTEAKPKDFHTRLMERYQYQNDKQRRKVSQIEI